MIPKDLIPLLPATHAASPARAADEQDWQVRRALFYLTGSEDQALGAYTALMLGMPFETLL